jgi:hypothetical protein
VNSEMRKRRERHSLIDFIVVIGQFGDHPMVIGSVEESTYDALREEDKWEEQKAEWHSRLGMDEEVPLDTLHDIRVSAWFPWVWELPEINAETAEEVD